MNYQYSESKFKSIVRTHAGISKGGWVAPSLIENRVRYALNQMGLNLTIPSPYSCNGNISIYLDTLWEQNKHLLQPNTPSVQPRQNQGGKGSSSLQCRLQDVSDRISLQKRRAEEAITQIDEAKPVIEVKRRWYGAINKDSIEESLFNVFDASQDMTRICGNGIRSLSENLGATFDLITLLAKIDEDIYDTLRQEAKSDKTFKSGLNERLNDLSNNDSQIKEILEISFSKAEKLKGLLNDLEAKFHAEISKVDKSISSLKVAVTNVINRMDAMNISPSELRRESHNLKIKINILSITSICSLITAILAWVLR